MPGRRRTQSPAATSVSRSSSMNFAQPLVNSTMCQAAVWRCQPVPCSGARFAFTSWAITRPPAAATMPGARWRQKSRSPSTRQGVSPGFACENSETVGASSIGAVLP